MRFDDYSRATPSHTLLRPTDQTYVILACATALLMGALPMIQRRGLTLIGIALANLVDLRGVQLVLPFERVRELDPTIDMIRERFGTSAITRGILVGHDPGISVPLLPD
jgi:DNA polymerase-4